MTWAADAEEKERYRIASFRSRLDSDQVKLDKDEAAGKDAFVIRRDRERINDDRESIEMTERWLKTCSDMVRTELEVAAHNREDPSHPEAETSDIRKRMCGGP